MTVWHQLFSRHNCHHTVSNTELMQNYQFAFIKPEKGVTTDTTQQKNTRRSPSLRVASSMHNTQAEALTKSCPLNHTQNTNQTLNLETDKTVTKHKHNCHDVYIRGLTMCLGTETAFSSRLK